MNHEFMSMIREQKGKVKSGRTVVHLAAKKRARVVQKSRSCFFLIQGVVYHEFVPRGQTVNAAFYVEVSETSA
jgi:hypothetical protein